ncbi:MAG: lysophospholipid acyltransferase family protein [Anaerolineales bacterium]|nr:lysophospholipid acyltransferase family protein [Anaerolineales bacterium]
MPDISVVRTSSLGTPFFQRFARLVIKAVGWRTEGNLPEVPKFVLIVHPHTSNWDVPYGMFAALALGLFIRWPYGFMVKDAALRWPLIGGLMRWLGGIGIDRTSRFNAVEQMVQFFQAQEKLMLVITPEGTRRHTKYWKSGFYHIALGAGVPVVPAYIDFGHRRAGLGPVLYLTGDVDADLAYLREFYSDKHGLYPREAGEIRFRPEPGPDAPPTT